MCIHLDSIVGVCFTVSVDLRKFFDSCLHCYRFCRILPGFFSFQGFVLRSGFDSLFVWRGSVLQLQRPRKTCYLNGCCLLSSRILSRIFSVTLNCSLGEKLAALLTKPVTWFNSKTNCNTYSLAFNSDDGKAFVLNEQVPDFLSVKMTVGFACFPQKITKLWSTKCFVENSFEWIDILSWSREMYFDPNATQA